MQMPRQLRCFDYDEEQYRTCGFGAPPQQLPQAEEHSPQFEIGVAFVGNQPPATAATDPARRFDISAPPTERDLWGRS